MAKKYNLKLIKKKQSYTVKEVAQLFCIGKRSVFRWIDKGLKPIDSGRRPFLIMGFDLYDFLKHEQLKNKVKLKEDEFYCMKCQKSRKATKVEIVDTGKILKKSGQKQKMKIGKCTICKTKVNKLLPSTKTTI